MNEQGIWRSLRIILGFLILGMAFLQYQWLMAQGQFEKHFLWSFELLGVMFCLNLIEPPKTEKSRLMLLLLQLLVLLFASTFGSFQVFVLLFVCLGAVASTQLTGKRMALFLVLIASGHAFVRMQARFPHPSTLEYSRLFPWQTEIYQLSVIFVVCLLGQKTLAERQARKEAERLSHELQTMTVALERKRIAQDMHDNLGHNLSSLAIQLELVDKFIDQDSKEKSKEACTAARALASDSFEELRRAIEAVRSDFDLGKAIASLASKVAEQRKLTLDLDLEDPGLPGPSRHQLFCIVMECLTNIQRHSQATAVKIRLKQIENKVELSVQDNGIGFNPEKPLSGSGILGMKDRAQSLGGSLKIDHGPDCGTVVHVVVPA